MNDPPKTPSPPARSWFQRFFYELVRLCTLLTFRIFLRLRTSGLERIPPTGPVLICPNHQSHLDPMIMGCLSPRRMNFLAKKQLFRFPPLSWLISFLDSIPIDREGISAGGIKECLKRMRRGEMLLMFPEGTRTPDGEMKTTLPGFVALVKRTGATVLPVGIDGAWDVWPRNRSFPLPGPGVTVYFGQPIEPAGYQTLEDRELVVLLDRRIRECIQEARRMRGKKV
jgi:1-acyl-sn-glycerol-3-phosphate acyltransferase